MFPCLALFTPHFHGRSLLPIVKTLTAKAGIEVDKVDISLAGRIISSWPKYLTDEQRQADGLAELGELCKTKDANIIKLPNVSASIPQLNEAITELRTQGFDVPMYVAKPTTDKEKVIHERYAKVLGSAVNPVLREGNSDRRVAPPVKNYAKKNPHTLGGWSRASRSHVAHMDKGDFYGSEKSHTMAAAGTVRIEHVAADGTVRVCFLCFPPPALIFRPLVRHRLSLHCPVLPLPGDGDERWLEVAGKRDHRRVFHERA